MLGDDLAAGTTSACAENTSKAFPANYRTWNYLRVRGEYHLRPLEQLFQ
ncbi:Uncharacterised protein [Corynebacterium matruchotii]|uniref:Uncharacterized protein n=2 Tax=Corynebacterium matruchotii TaxID=43768 RepID=E0DCA4_9CORY|nr:hypothetical protein HMPREF0299_5953 [Corynebacterium matruchotii ATCC 14266]SPW24156.1 Uncharacterised protein [Corynebacterium matruchotii]